MGIRFILKKIINNISDTFTGPDGTDLNGRRTETGGKTWARLDASGAVAEISGGTAKLRAGSGSGFSRHVFDTGAPDGTLEVTLATAPTTYGSALTAIIFRGTGSGDYWSLTTRASPSMRYSIGARTGDTAGSIALATEVIPANGDRIKLEISGPTVTLFVNGVNLGNANMGTTHAAGTQVGIAVHGSDTVTALDDFTYTPAG